jgi:putative ABC transport system substrate-binding protein
MRRRQFLARFSSAVAAPVFTLVAARAQQTDSMRRVGVLMITAETDRQAQDDRATLIGGLQRLGWSEGQNVSIDYRWGAGSGSRLADLANELVSLRPDVIVAQGTPGLAAVRAATRTVPIVFSNVTDPVGQGFVESLARPGGNITGFALFEFSMGGKWLEVLKSIAPSIKHVGLLFNPPVAPYSKLYFQSLEAAAPRFGITPFFVPVDNEKDLEQKLSDLAKEKDQGLIVLLDAFTHVHRKFLIAQIARNRIPTIYAARYFAVDGGLVAYGADITDQFRQAVSYVDRILKGAKPAELPIQQPTKFELVVNVKTASALGFEIPAALLVSADEVIE